MLNGLENVVEELSATVTVNEKVPVRVGFPEIVSVVLVEAASVKPGGSAPEVIVQL